MRSFKDYINSNNHLKESEEYSRVTIKNNIISIDYPSQNLTMLIDSKGKGKIISSIDKRERTFSRLQMYIDILSWGIVEFKNPYPTQLIKYMIDKLENGYNLYYIIKEMDIPSVTCEKFITKNLATHNTEMSLDQAIELGLVGFIKPFKNDLYVYDKNAKSKTLVVKILDPDNISEIY